MTAARFTSGGGAPGSGNALPRALKDLVVPKLLELSFPGSRGHGVWITTEQANELCDFAGAQLPFGPGPEQHDRSVQGDTCWRHDRGQPRLCVGLALLHDNSCELLAEQGQGLARKTPRPRPLHARQVARPRSAGARTAPTSSAHRRKENVSAARNSSALEAIRLTEPQPQLGVCRK
jgi:hypothetical protein